MDETDAYIESKKILVATYVPVLFCAFISGITLIGSIFFSSATAPSPFHPVFFLFSSYVLFISSDDHAFHD